MNKGRSNDHDFVPPTQCKSSRTKQPRPSLLSQLELIPKFEAMELENAKGSSQNLHTIDSSSPETLFSLFFTDSVLDRIVRCTNINAEEVRVDPVATRAKNIRCHDSLDQLPWKPVTSSEILAYLGILVYMGIHVAPHINDYWNTSDEDCPIHQPVQKTMSIHRWKQIDRHLHIWNPALDRLSERPDDKVQPHEKINPLLKLLSSSFQRYWKPGRDLAINECIKGFTSRTPDIVNTPTKPTPVGFKVWVLADNGYVLDLLWHVKGDGQDQGPQGLRTTWGEQGFSRTQAVVLELMTRMPNEGKGHTVWLSNLFTSSKLLTTLRNYGIGAAGTVRTGRTKREENEERKQLEELRSNEPTQDHDGPDSELLDSELPDSEKPLWNYLFQTTICNAALIWMDQGHSTKKKGGNLKFRKELASQLMAYSSSLEHASPIDGFGVCTNIRNHIITSKNGCNGTHNVISQSAKECKACMAQGRTAQASGKRMALQELSDNSVRINQNGEKSRRPRPPRTRYGCSACQIHLCRGGTCWEEHTQSSKLE
jgi:hypothetical protein